ncbi:MAG: hypothetical protein C0483_25085 [Pirellula sp.]|nr:hypothetical protein [Pirellula sp.]
MQTTRMAPSVCGRVAAVVACCMFAAVPSFAAAQDADVAWTDPAALAALRKDRGSLPPALRLVDVVEGSAEPNIADPGPDMGDFPNSAFTLPRGRVYIESAPLTMITGDSFGPAAYLWPYLLRYGVTDDMELRLLGNGLTSVFGGEPTSGFSPTAIDMKVHLWDGNERFIPASSLEVYLLTPWGSPAFQGGWQPSLNMNFDLPISQKTNLEWTLGYSGVRDAVNVNTGERVKPRFHHLVPALHVPGANVYQFSVQWAIERTVTERLQVFLHGYIDGTLLLQQGSGKVIGVGGQYQLTERWMTFGSCNAGLDDAVAPFSGQWGFAFAL